MPTSMPFVAPVDMTTGGGIHNLADPAAQGDASTMRRMGSFYTAPAATTLTTGSNGGAATKLGQFTFTAVAGRRYLVRVTGPLNNDTGNAILWRILWVAGATVTTANGTNCLEAQCVTGQGFTQATYAENELCTANGNALTAGTVAMGLFVQCVAGSGSSRYGNGSTQPCIVSCYDVGT